MFKKYILPALITAVAGGINYYVTIPALNWRSPELWGFILFLIVVFLICHLIARLGLAVVMQKASQKKHSVDFSNNKKGVKITVAIFAIIALAVAAVWISSSALFNASSYQQMISVSEREFEEDIAEISFSQIPIVDKATAQRLGSRKIGEVVELVSQFDVSDMYTQINFQQTPVRISPLEYNSFIKWFVNRDDGIPYYVYIDMATQETELIELESGMKYSPSEYFGRDLLRHARFAYPTKMFDEVSFEIDDAGKPYWIISTYNYTIGVLGGRDVDGIIMVDAITGDTQFYSVSEIPSWVDMVYPADLAMQQINYWGEYVGGYWNSVFAQTGVIAATDGYNYIAFDDDVWMFTGLTSVVSDESNIGFILVNMRTKECRRYNINGAEEYSAMASAEGKVQEKRYTSTFPILLNINDTPTYFVSLKDNAGLVKAYGFVSVSSYQNVAVGDTIQAAQEEYIKLIGGSNSAESEISETTDIAGKVEQFSTAVKDGNSYYYIRLAGKNTVYIASISAGEFLPLLKVGDEVTLTVPVQDKEYINVISAKLTKTAAPAVNEPSSTATESAVS